MIDGTTQPGNADTCLAETGHPCIEIDATAMGPSPYVVDVGGGSSTIRGLVINRTPFNGAAIHIFNLGGNVIEGDYLGTDMTGSIGSATTAASS